MTNGILYNFSMENTLYREISGTKQVAEGLQPVGYVKDIKPVGSLYHASAPTDAARREWRRWRYLNGAYENTSLQVELPDLGSDCSIIIVTPEGVSIQQGQTISAGTHTLPSYPMRMYCIVDRALTAQEITNVQTAYGSRYYINYDATIAARTLSGTTYSTEALGWVANTDVGASGEVQALINSLANGDTVIFDAMYKISGNYILSALSNITFRAATRQQHGFNCLDGVQELADANLLPLNIQPVFNVGSGFLADGLKLTQDTVDPTLLWGGGGKAGWFWAEDKVGGPYVIDCLLDTMGWIGVNVRKTSGAVVARCTLEDLKYVIYLFGAADNMIVAHNYFTGGYLGKTLDGSQDQSFYDGIKTVDALGRGPENPVFVENELIAILRDGIDTTGGFKDAIIDANVARNVSINWIDLKSQYLDSEDVTQGLLGNSGVSMRYNLVDGIVSFAIILTTTWTAPETPDPDLAAGPLASYRNVYRARDDETPPKWIINKNSQGIQSSEDTFVGTWSSAFVEDEDDYTPSFVVTSVITDPIYIL